MKWNEMKWNEKTKTETENKTLAKYFAPRPSYFKFLFR